MKIKKYGGFEMVSGSELNFAIAIRVVVGKVVEKGNTESYEEERIEYRFITKIDRKNYSWEIENNKFAYLFEDRSIAQEICACMIQNGTYAFVVECLGKDKLKNWF